MYYSVFLLFKAFLYSTWAKYVYSCARAWNRPQSRNFSVYNAFLVRMSSRQVFQDIVAGIRSDLKYLREDLFSLLANKRGYDPYGQNDEVRNWILDVFLDKLFEIHAKIERLFVDFNIQRDLPIWEIKRCAEDLAFARGRGYNQAVLREMFHELSGHIQEYDVIVEKSMGTIRKILNDQNWEPMKRINLDNYILPVKRARYVDARGELSKAKNAIKAGNWEEVLNHLRPAIDLALKEKFGFKRIKGYKQFFDDAEKYDLPLPSYDMIYRYFDEASQRLHEGRVHTPWECQEALDFVAKFIDRLDLIDVSDKEIDEFKKKSKSVE